LADDVAWVSRVSASRRWHDSVWQQQWPFRATKIIDPHDQETNVTLGGAYGLITRVTEPGGRYLQFTYDGPYL
jgi:hypothetical protein